MYIRLYEYIYILYCIIATALLFVRLPAHARYYFSVFLSRDENTFRWSGNEDCSDGYDNPGRRRSVDRVNRRLPRSGGQRPAQRSVAARHSFAGDSATRHPERRHRVVMFVFLPFRPVLSVMPRVCTCSSLR